MRDIKFRQYYYKQFHYWGFIKEGVFVNPLTGCNSCPSYQFTGLKDKNGKEIYEGDIIKYPSNMGIVKQGLFVDCGVGIESGWYIEYKDGDVSGCISSYGEVVGNVHENPELLEGGKNEQG